VLSCPFSHNTTLQHYRLLDATATVTNEKIHGELPRNPRMPTSPTRNAKKFAARNGRVAYGHGLPLS
jgi:hypothetical protein